MGTIVEGGLSCPRALRAAGALALAALAAAAAFEAPHAAAAVADYTFVTIPPPVLQASSNFGERVRAIGDIDDDGVRDVLMSSSTFDGEDANGATLANSGRAYVFSGRTQALLRVVDPPFPQAGGRFGFWDASLGDVDGDGAGDFVVGASGMIVGGATIGQAYIFSGRTGQRLRTLNPPEPITPTSPTAATSAATSSAPATSTATGSATSSSAPRAPSEAPAPSTRSTARRARFSTRPRTPTRSRRSVRTSASAPPSSATSTVTAPATTRSARRATTRARSPTSAARTSSAAPAERPCAR